MNTMSTIDSILKHYEVPQVEIEFDLGSLEFSLHHLRTVFWDKAAPMGPIWNLKLENQLKYTKGQLVVLSQYPLVLDQLKALQQSTVPIPFRGMLITGSPSIGMWLVMHFAFSNQFCTKEKHAAFGISL